MMEINEVIKIAITGVIGSGKSTLAGLLRELDIYVIDADEISRELTKKGTEVYKRIIDAFGSEILKEDGEINRKTLASIVFNDLSKRKILEDIIHPEVKKICEDRARTLEKEGKDIIVLDIPLLFEAGMEDMVDYVILAYADVETLYNRVQKRDKMSKEEFLSRLKNQMSLEEKAKKSHFIVDTRKSLADLKLELFEIIRKVRDRIGNTQSNKGTTEAANFLSS